MWQTSRADASAAIKSYKKYDSHILLSILAVLYWAEGTKYEKGGIVFTNTDPKLAYFFISLLGETCGIDESRFWVRSRLHYYHKKRETVTFWAGLLDIPVNQFQSAFVKKRSTNKRYRKNFVAICFIKYGDTKTRRKILSYAYALQEHLAPVAQLD